MRQVRELEKNADVYVDEMEKEWASTVQWGAKPSSFTTENTKGLLDALRTWLLKAVISESTRLCLIVESFFLQQKRGQEQSAN